MVTATISEAKASLSELVEKAQSGETVIITSGPDEVPVARLEPVAPGAKDQPEKIAQPGKKRLGILETPGFVLTDAFWEPLSDEEMGYGE